MAPSHFTSLPVEILRHICAQFCKHCRDKYGGRLEPTTEEPPDAYALYDHHHSRALVPLSRTCRRLASVAQPVLYHDVVRPRALLRLLRTLVARPDLAAVVRGLHDPDMGWDAPEGDEAAAVEEARARAGVVFPENWAERWHEDGLYMRTRVFGLLIGLMTSLEAMTYTVECTWPDEDGNNEAVTIPGLGWPTFPSLRHLNLEYNDSENGFILGKSLETRDLINGTPYLCSLRLSMCYGVDPGLRLDRLRSLIFDNCSISGDDMVATIGACPLLERFAYNTGDVHVKEYTDRDEFLPSELWLALHARRATLRHLDLGFERDCQDIYQYLESKREEGFTANERFGSFADFNALETFVAMTDLFRSDDDGGAALDLDTFHNSEALVRFLPKGVRVLGLEIPEGCGYEGGVVLAEAVARGLFPNLKRVALSAPAREWHAVVAAFEAVGVTCERYRETWSSENRRAWQAQWPGYF